MEKDIEDYSRQTPTSSIHTHYRRLYRDTDTDNSRKSWRFEERPYQIQKDTELSRNYTLRRLKKDTGDSRKTHRRLEKCSLETLETKNSPSTEPESGECRTWRLVIVDVSLRAEGILEPPSHFWLGCLRLDFLSANVLLVKFSHRFRAGSLTTEAIILARCL